MTKLPECIPALIRVGIDLTDALALRRCAMQLHRWYEMECGCEHGAVERDEATGKTYHVSSSGRRWPCRDMETPALARVAKIMARYPDLSVYHQTDPRGAPIYVIRPSDVPAGGDVGGYYSRGLPVYK